MSAILKFDFQKKRITFFWSKLSELHKKDPILHVATTFSLKQGETRTSHGPHSTPLNLFKQTIVEKSLLRQRTQKDEWRKESCTVNIHKVNTFLLAFII